MRLLRWHEVKWGYMKSYTKSHKFTWSQFRLARFSWGHSIGHMRMAEVTWGRLRSHNVTWGHMRPVETQWVLMRLLVVTWGEETLGKMRSYDVILRELQRPILCYAASLTPSQKIGAYPAQVSPKLQCSASCCQSSVSFDNLITFHSTILQGDSTKASKTW